jgi:hypothetical protein
MNFQNSDQPINTLITPPDQFNRVTAFLGLSKKEWLAAQLFIAEYNRDLYNRELEAIIIKECKKTAENFFDEQIKDDNTELKIIE